MFHLSRKQNDGLTIIAKKITIHLIVTKISKGIVQIAVEAPDNVSIFRSELLAPLIRADAKEVPVDQDLVDDQTAKLVGGKGGAARMNEDE